MTDQQEWPKAYDGEQLAKAVREWLQGRDAAEWHPTMIGPFSRGYDTAVEEIRALCEAAELSPDKP